MIQTETQKSGLAKTNLQAELKARSDLHFSRKLLHAGGIAFILGIYLSIPRQVSLVLLAIACTSLIPLDYLRRYSKSWNRFVIKVMGKFMRKGEVHQLTGTSYLLVGLTLIISLFPVEIVTLSMIMIALGDPAASITGVLYGKDKIFKNKSLQGSIGAFLTCTIIAGIYYYVNEMMLERWILASILSGFIGAISELIPIGKMDDNFSFPVIASSLLWILFHLFGATV